MTFILWHSSTPFLCLPSSLFQVHFVFSFVKVWNTCQCHMVFNSVKVNLNEGNYTLCNCSWSLVWTIIHLVHNLYISPKDWALFYLSTKWVLSCLSVLDFSFFAVILNCMIVHALYHFDVHCWEISGSQWLWSIPYHC